MQRLRIFAYALLAIANLQIGMAAIAHSNEIEGFWVLVCAFAYLLALASHRSAE